ncbi:MAG: polysaccharide deacetylase family protein [Eubacteriales bacterium]|nr:polysaccharide deacetylase family protein [Eubacteriales bacterium]
MKRTKWLRWGVLILCLLVGMTAVCSVRFLRDDELEGEVPQEQTTEIAQPEPETEGPEVMVNGIPMETPSALAGDTVMIAAEEFAERMDAEYTFDETSGAITLTWEDRTAELTLDETTAILNGEETEVAAPYQRDNVVKIPAEAVAESLAAGATTYQETLYLTPYAGEWEIPQGYNVPILMYHAISDDCWGYSELFVSPSTMEEQLNYLTENGYTTITFEDLYRIDEIEKPVMLTFDDGYDDNYENLYPLLQKYNCKATIFVIAGAIGSTETHKMTEEQVRELSESGLVSIQSHTNTHPYLDEISAKEQKREMRLSSRTLLACTGKQPFVLCYPSGRYDENTLELGPKYYRFGLKMTGGMYNTSDDPFQISRYYIARNTDLNTFASYIQG